MKKLKMVADRRKGRNETRIALYFDRGGLVHKGALVLYYEKLNKLGEWEEAEKLGIISNGKLADNPSAINYILNMDGSGIIDNNNSDLNLKNFTDFRKAEERDFPKEEKDSQKEGNNKGRNEMEEETNEDVKADINQLINIRNTIEEHKKMRDILYKKIEGKRTNKATLAKQAVKDHIMFLGYFGVTENRHDLYIDHRRAWDAIECLIKDFVVLMANSTCPENEERRTNYYIEKLNNMISKMADGILKS